MSTDVRIVRTRSYLEKTVSDIEKELSLIETIFAAGVSRDAPATDPSLKGRLVIIKGLLEGFSKSLFCIEDIKDFFVEDKSGRLILLHCEEAVVRRAALKSYFVVIQSFLVPDTISKEQLGEILISAAKKDDLTTVQTLLAQGDISRIYKILAMQHSAELNRVGVFNAFLLDSDLSEVDWSTALKIASKTGSQDIVQVLLARIPISEEARGKAISKAAFNGYLEIVKILLAHKGPILEEARDKAIIKAVEGCRLAEYRRATGFSFRPESEYLGIVETLLDIAPISEEGWSKVIICAACNKYAGILELLLGRTSISEQTRGEALIEAVRAKAQDSAIILLANGSISKEYLGAAFRRVALDFNLPLLEMLLANGPILDADKTRALTDIISSYDCYPFQGHFKKDPLPFVKALLDHGSTEKMRGEIVIKAAEKRCKDIVEVVLGYGPILESDRGLAVRWAAYHRNLPILETLLANGAILASDKTLALTDSFAKNYGSFEEEKDPVPCIKALLKHGSTTKEMIEKAVIKAIQTLCDVSVLEVFLAHDSIRQEVLEEAVITVIGKRGYDFLEKLLAHGPISLEVRKQAIQKGFDTGNTAVVLLLLRENEFFNIELFDLKDNEELCLKIIPLALGYCNFRTLRMLLVSPKVFARALIEAFSLYERFQIPRYLVAFDALLGPFLKLAHLISSEDRGRLATILMRKADLKALYIVLTTGPILDRDLKDCIKYAEAELKRATTDSKKQILKSIIEIFEKCSFSIERAKAVELWKITRGDKSKITRSEILEGIHTGLSKETCDLLGIKE